MSTAGSADGAGLPAAGAFAGEPSVSQPWVSDLFIYYRVPNARAAAAAVVAHDCQQRLRTAHPRLLARLLRRPEEVDGQQTWMETYRIADRGGDADGRVAAGIDAGLQAAIEAHLQPLADHIAGPRHVERFVACA